MKAKSSQRFMQFALCCALVLTMAFIGGCKGSSGSDGVSGTSGVDATTPVNGAPSATETLQASIISASVTTNATSGSLVVTFKLLDEKGAPLDPRNLVTAGGRCRFFVAQIDATGNYKNYLTNSSGAPTYDSASSPSVATAATSTYFAPTATPGVYTFTFSKDITANAIYDATLTHTVAAQISRTITSSKGVSFAQNVNPYFNFRPDGAAVTVTREVVAVSNCNECHGTLTGHGTRVETALCILCHNPGVVDPTTGNSVDFKAMIHKIHMGENLPSNKAGNAYTVGSTSFADVAYPATSGDSFTNNKPMECTKCHKAGKDAKGNTYGADVDKWKASPVIANCVTCHDLTTFDLATTVSLTNGKVATTATAVPHTGASSAKVDGQCAVCHDQTESQAFDGALSVQAVHMVPLNSSLNTGLAFNVTSVEAVSGSTITVHFTVKDSSGAAYDLIGGNGSAGNVISGTTITYADSCAIVFGYMTGADYDNSDPTFVTNKSNRSKQFFEGETKTVSSTSVSPTTFRVGAGEYVVSMGSVTVPAVTGVGTIAVYGKKAIVIPDNAATKHRTASQRNSAAYGIGANKPSGFYNFNLADGTAAAAADLRREVVSMDKCNNCHLNMNAHSRADTKVCVLCHGPNLLEKNYKNLVNGSGNLKDFVHGIHGAQVLSDTTSTLFHGVTKVEGFPNDARNCTICHISDPMTLDVPTTAKSTIRSATTQTTGTPTTMAPIGAACTSCHDSAASQAHVAANTPGTPGVESCTTCHASGKAYGNVHAPVK